MHTAEGRPDGCVPGAWVAAGLRLGMRLDLLQQAGVRQELALNLAPQLLQWLHILQLPTEQLSAMVQHEVETNPALELDGEREADELPVPDEDAGSEPDESLREAEAVEERLQALAEIDDWQADSRLEPRDASAEADDGEWHRYVMDSIRGRTSLHDHLLAQLACAGLAPGERGYAELVIGSLDERGYLTVELAELASLARTGDGEMARALGQVQALDPPGVAARDLRECLLLQLQHLNGSHELARRVVRDYLMAAAQKSFALIGRELGVGEEEVRSAIGLIAALNPAPGLAFDTRPTEYVSPDVVVTLRHGVYEVELVDEYVPRLRISASCRRLLAERALAGSDLAFVRRKMRQAAFLIQGIAERQSTLRKVAQQIVRIQREYLDGPPGELQPLTMAKVGRLIGVHETTVGRAAANKYMQTPRGLFEMKHFFRKGYGCRDGSGLTPEALKAVIGCLFRAEEPGRPLTDLDVVQRLAAERGLQMARRTVAKYREELNIPSSKERVRRLPAATFQAAG
jgi:RNA polymerase sigma-54 factor